MPPPHYYELKVCSLGNSPTAQNAMLIPNPKGRNILSSNVEFTSSTN
jgi:hypothetical protein